MPDSNAHPTRRDFVRTASSAAALAILPFDVAPRRQTPAIPYVDGLCLSSERVWDGPAATGLTAFLLDVSAGEEQKDARGATVFVRSFEACLRSIAGARRQMRGHADRVFLAARGADVAEARRSNRSAVFFQIQGGGEAVGEDLRRLEVLHELGVRIVQLTHHFDNPLAGGALVAPASGLTKLGVEAIERMNALGIIPDLSHASDLTARDTVRASKRPVIVSHAAARAIVDNARCVPDETIRGVAETGGVVGVFMMSFWLTRDPVPTVDHVVRHLRHIIDVGGVDAAGVANDYGNEGDARFKKLGNDQAEHIKGYLPWWESIRARGIRGFEVTPTHVVIPELNHLGRMRTIHSALERHRFTSAEIEKVMGGNWMRVLESSLG